MLSERIKELRLLKGYNQSQLADILNVSKQSVSNWENDNIQPSVEMLLHLSQVFSVSTDYLLGREVRRDLNTMGLNPEELEHLQAIIDLIKNNRQN